MVMCFGPASFAMLGVNFGKLGPRGIGPKYDIDQSLRLRRLEVADERQAGVVGRVVSAEECGDVGAARGREVGHRTNDAVMVGVVRRIHRRQQLLDRLAIRHVVNRCRRSFLTTSRSLSSFCCVKAGRRNPIRSDSSQSASSKPLEGTVSK